MKTKSLSQLVILSLFITIVSCKKNNPEPQESISQYRNGVFVINEGLFGSGTGTISFFSKDSQKVYSDIFQTVNHYALGNIAQSMEVFYEKGYVVVNNAGKVVVVDANDFTRVTEITGFNMPRYFLGINASKAYVSEWGAGGSAGSIKVINLQNNTIAATIPTGKGANKMIKKGNYVYVACNGGYDNDSVITVIDAVNDVVVKNIVAGANPSFLKEDVNGNIWVLCLGRWDAGYTMLEKSGALVKINTATDVVSASFTLASLYSQPSNLVMNSAKNKLYYLFDGGLYSFDIASTALNTQPLINRSFYGLAIDPVENILYASDAGNYTSNGKVLRYQISGVAIDSFAAGIIPGEFCFR